MDCKCKGCGNLEENEEIRFKHMIRLIDRNKNAFTPKIKVEENKHSKGCNCKKSNCDKNYCECRLNNVKC